MSPEAAYKKVFGRPQSLKEAYTHYCPGCGHSVAHRLVAECLDEMGLREVTIGVPPVGCAVLAYNYFNFDMVEAPHGRALAVATGIKRVRPESFVLSYQGDGDLAAIGTAETIHAANRGEGISTIFINNAIYGRLAALDLWRAVEAQHVASTMALVDTVAEQTVLERLIEGSKPPVPRDVARLDLHWLLFTPFRYAPPPGGSRFRGPNDPGVFYGAEHTRTACAEVGYWRWRHLRDTPGIAAMPPRPQTVFKVPVAGTAIDLHAAPFERDRDRWTHRSDYDDCQAIGRAAREAGVQWLRYESVRDSRHGGCGVVFDAAAFASRAPTEQQGWILTVTQTHVVWQRSDPLNPGVFEFSAAGWQ